MENKLTSKQAVKNINEIEKKQRTRIEEDVEELRAPIFGLDKWKKEHELVNPEMEAYIEATKQQKGYIVLCVLLITIIVNYLRYGVP